jgi:hypothetical protein
MVMLSEFLSAFNNPSGKPIGAVPRLAVDVFDRRGWLDDVADLRPDGAGGMLLTCHPASPLAELMRHWPDAADELAESLGRVGYCISAVPVVVVHVERGHERWTTELN